MEAKDRKALLGFLVHIAANEELIVTVYFLALMGFFTTSLWSVFHIIGHISVRRFLMPFSLHLSVRNSIILNIVITPYTTVNISSSSLCEHPGRGTTLALQLYPLLPSLSEEFKLLIK